MMFVHLVFKIGQKTANGYVYISILFNVTPKHQSELVV